MIIKLFTFSLLASFAMMLALAQPDSRAADPAPAANDRSAMQDIVADLVKLVGEGRIDQMLDHIGPISNDERDAYEKSREQLMAIYGNAGKYSGYDIAGYKAVTPRYQIVYAIAYFDKRPVLFEFGFYQVDGKWRAQTFRVPADLRELLDSMPLQK